MYTLSQLREALRNPEWFARELYRLYTHRLNLYDHNRDGVDVFSEDWDNLIILDACRYDEFRERNDLPGELHMKISRGATSSEFVRGNFTGRELHDVVYISANPYYSYLKDEIDAEVYKYIPLHEEEYRTVGGGHTTPPGTVTEYTLKAAEKYPDKRIMTHYLQPHHPYIGQYGRERFEPRNGLIDTVKANKPTEEELLKAYRENLDLVLEEVRKLFGELEGKTVVSADHGELLGENLRPLPVRDYGHNAGIYLPELLEIPWLVYEDGERREIVAEEPVEEDEEIGREEIESHLEELGYI